MKRTKHISIYISSDKTAGAYLGAKFETTLETEDGEDTSEEELGKLVLATTLEDLERAKQESPVVREIYRDFIKNTKRKRKVEKAMED